MPVVYNGYTYHDIYGLSRNIYNIDNDPANCAVLDPLLAQMTQSYRDVAAMPLYYADPVFYPLLGAKINTILCAEYNAGTITEDTLGQHRKWLGIETKKVAVDKWLDKYKDTACYRLYYVRDLIEDVFADSKERRINILTALVKQYKLYKNNQIMRILPAVFAKADTENIEAYCEIISAGTPLLKSVFLRRDDVPEKYLLMGVKSLSKLSAQKDVDTKIDFKILAKLGPRGRLKAIKQLLGMFDVYYKNMIYYQEIYKDEFYANRYKERFRTESKKSLPFKVIPTQEEMETFLFPCSMKFTVEVARVMEQFKFLLESNKGVNNGQCV